MLLNRMKSLLGLTYFKPIQKVFITFYNVIECSNSLLTNLIIRLCVYIYTYIQKWELKSLTF